MGGWTARVLLFVLKNAAGAVKNKILSCAEVS